MIYPHVLSESATLDLVLQKRSLARYGDGEFTLAGGKSIVNQPRHPVLCTRMREILQGQSGECLVGIPNIRSHTPKVQFWSNYLVRGAALLCEGQSYVSSFVSRPDSAPWINEPSYWRRLEALWAGKEVTLVRGTTPNGTGGVSLLKEDLTTAALVTEIIGPAVGAWAQYDALLEQIGQPKTALLCLGATATVMAVDLCAKGVHAIDLGHIGMFLHRLRAGEPVIQSRVKRTRATA